MEIERIIELVINMMTEIQKEKKITDIDLEKFEKLGYSNIEISTAVSWIMDENASFMKQVNEHKSKDLSFRILSNSEQELFTVEAWGEIIQLLALGLINNDVIEILIERVIMSGIPKIDGKLVRYFLAYHIFDVGVTGKPNNKYVLAGNETIN